MLAAAASVVLAIGASDAPDDPRSRLQSMSVQHRTELAEALKHFELQLNPDQQKSIRDLDRRLNQLPAEERARYLAAMRRYHNWLDSLPDKERDDLQVKQPGERMAQIKKMLSRFPLPSEGTPPWLQLADFAGPSPYETAAIFRIWQGLTTQQRQEIEALTAPGERRMKLMAHGRELRLLREIRPADFSIDDWIPKVEAKLAEIQPLDPKPRRPHQG